MSARPPNRPYTISPSSYKLHTACNRAWWYKYVGRKPTPTTDALLTGTAVHAEIEHYLGRRAGAPDAPTGTWSGRTTPAAVRARAGEGILAPLVAPGAWVDVQVEARAAIDLAPWGGVYSLAGRVDWTARRATDRLGHVADHKSTANPLYWHTSATLATDAQVLAYAGALYPGEAVRVGHLYYPPPEAPPGAPPAPAPAAVWADVSASATYGVLADYARVTIGMARDREATDPGAVAADQTACGAYRGCPFATFCDGADPAVRDRLVAQAARNQANKGPIVMTPQMAALRAKLGLPAAAPAPPSTDAPAPPVPSGGDDADALATVLAAEVSPPDAPRRAPRTKRAPKAPAHDPLLDPSPTPAPAVVADPADTADAEAPASTSAPAPDPARFPDRVEVEEEARGTPAPLSALGRPSTIILWGCTTRAPHLTIEEAFGDVVAEANEAAGGKRDAAGLDYLCVPYGAGVREVARRIAAILRSYPGLYGGTLVLPATHPVAPFLVPAAEAAGYLVVRGGAL